MDKLPRFAKVFAGRRRIVEMDISLRLRNLAEFFNSLLEGFLSKVDAGSRKENASRQKTSVSALIQPEPILR